MLLIFSVEWLVIDESDKLFEDGKTGFRDQVGIFIIHPVELYCYSKVK